MKQNLRLGRVAGIPVGVQWSAVAIVLLIALTLATSVLPSYAPGRPQALYWAVAIPGAAVFLACLLAHELAHSLVAVRKGVEVKSITLWMLGGISELGSEAPDPKADFAIAAAGPATSLGLGAAAGVGALVATGLRWSALITGSLLWLAIINAFLGAFNLLPGAPLDGGRVLRAILWRHYRDRVRAELAATRAGRTLGMLIVALGLAQILFFGQPTGLWTMFMGWFLTAAARAEETTRIARQALHGLTAADVMTPRPDTGAAWQDAEDFARLTVAESQQSVFPVLDFDGHPVGVVTAALLGRTPVSILTDVKLRSVMTPIGDEHVCPPDTPAERLVATHAVAGLVAVVMDGHQVVGMVTSDDLTRAMLRSPKTLP